MFGKVDFSIRCFLFSERHWRPEKGPSKGTHRREIIPKNGEVPSCLICVGDHTTPFQCFSVPQLKIQLGGGFKYFLFSPLPWGRFPF